MIDKDLRLQTPTVSNSEKNERSIEIQFKELIPTPEPLETREVQVNIPGTVLEMKKIFGEHGYNLWVVGGCPRDLIMGKEPKDWDLITDASPEIKMDLLEKLNQQRKAQNLPVYSLITIKTQEANGIIKLVDPTNGQDYEIATLRIDSGERRSNQVVFTEELLEDLERRDFTINTMVGDIDLNNAGILKILDYSRVLESLSDQSRLGILRTVNNAEITFEEDRSRMLRALMFAHRMNMVLSQDIIDALTKDNRLNLTNLSNGSREGMSPESKKEQLFKGIKTSLDTKSYLESLQKYGFLEQILPELDYSLENKNFAINDPILIIALLLSSNLENSEDLEKDLTVLKYTKEETWLIISLIEFSKALKEFKANVNLEKIATFKQKIIKKLKESISYKPAIDEYFKVNLQILSLTGNEDFKEKWSEFFEQEPIEMEKLMEELKREAEKKGEKNWKKGIQEKIKERTLQNANEIFLAN